MLLIYYISAPNNIKKCLYKNILNKIITVEENWERNLSLNVTCIHYAWCLHSWKVWNIEISSLSSYNKSFAASEILIGRGEKSK
mgnify:FL=1